jgi:hypothetical protein
MGLGAAVVTGIAAVSEAIGGVAASVIGAGVVADAIGTGVTGALIGAGVGAVGGAITGQGALKGAEFGALTGGTVGAVGPALGSALGIGTVGGDALAGAGAGALGAGLTGTNPLTGALEAGAGGALAGAAGALAPPGTSSGSAVEGATSGVSPISGGPGPSAAALAAPPGTAPDLPVPAPDAGTGAGTPGAPLPTPPIPPASGPPALGGGGAGLVEPGGPTPPADFTAPIGAGGAGDQASIGVTAAQPGADLTASPSTTLSNATAGIGAGADQQPFTLAATTSEPVTGVGAGADQPQSFTTADAANAASTNLPIPPVPPALDAAGNPVFDPGGAPTYPTMDAAQSALAFNQAGGVASTDTGAPTGTGFLGKAGDFLSKNAGLALTAGALGIDFLKSKQGLAAVPGDAQLTQIAQQEQAQSQQLEGFLTSGTLPPAVQTSLDQAARSATATIRSQYASRGMSGSSAEAQDVANAHNAIVSQGADIATKLLAQGISEGNLSASLFNTIFQANLSQDAILQNALGSLAAAAARPSISVKAA